MRLVQHALVVGLLAALAVPAALQGQETGKAALPPWGFDLTGIDRNASPGDDFFRYAVGAWVDRATIPADLPEWNTLDALSVKAEEDVRKVVEKAALKKPAVGTFEQKVVDAYHSYLDTETINSLGLKPFEDDLAYLGGLKTHEEVVRAFLRADLPVNSPIILFISIDGKNPDRYAVFVTQAGLGLPSRDFYLSDDPAFVQVRTKYREHIGHLLTLAGRHGALASAAAISDLEARIAKLQWPLEKVRDKDLTYNPKSRAELAAFAPGFPWQEALEAGGFQSQDRFIVQEAEAVAGLAQLFRDTPVSTWRDYLTFHYLKAQADILPAAFDDAVFELFGKTLGGQPQPRERWTRAVGEISGPYGAGPLGEAVGRLYVQEHFSPEARAEIREIVDHLLATYQSRIEKLAWMSPETRKAAIRKAQNVRVKIGFPDRWKDYSALTIRPGDAYGNRKRMAVFENARLLARLKGPTDKDEWSQGPQTVNAYYLPELNEIAFPAAILQPPFFDPNADPAINYGAVGGVIGHEMGHGYDDQGAKSDEHGVLRNWWQPADEERFHALTRALSRQYSSYSPLPGLHVNGDATSGENIGDLGGLSVALEAYQRSLGGQTPPVLDGYTGVQRFFLAWAQVWRGLYREERLRDLLTSDVHSPIMYRVNGVVRNMDAWYDAFGVKPENKLYLAPGERVRIW